MTRADRAIRYSTIAAVSVVALVAAFVSYWHALQVVRAHGESGALALAYPLTIDGLIYCASMVLLNAARQGTRAAGWPTPRWAWASPPPWPRTSPPGCPTARSPRWWRPGQRPLW